MTKKIKLNNADMKYLQADLHVEEASEANAAPKFLIKANAGSRMAFPDGDIVIDLAGFVSQKDARAIPILYGHDWDQQLGHATVARVDDEGIWLEGIVSVPSERAREWAASAKAGFPWQASLGFMVADSLAVEEDDEIDVNGRVEKGPVTIATGVQIWECSVVTFGADAQTSANVTAAAPRSETPNESSGDEVKAMEDKEKIVEAEATPNVAEVSVDAELEKIRAARVEENRRVDALEAIAKQYGDREYLNAAISEGWTADRFELETLRHARRNAPVPCAPSDVDAGEVAAAAMLRACGIKPTERTFGQAVLEAADRVKSSDLRGVFEAATGFTPTEAQRYDGREYFQAASLSTYNLPNVLSKTANAILLNALGNYERRWTPLFKVSSVNDFRKVERFRLDNDFEFQEVAEGQEFEHGTQTESGWEIQAKTYGKQYVLGWQSMINGEALGVFSDIMQQIAFGAESKLNRICWSLVMNPGNASDGTAFYHASHGSLKTSCALTLANLSAAISVFMTRKKANGVPIGVEPRYLVVPPSLLSTARNIVNATWVNASGVEGMDFNPMKGIVEIVTAPQLEFAEFTNYSATTWYLFADPNSLAPFEIAYLRGQQTPVIRSSELEIGRLGLAIDGHISFGVLAEDWRGALKCTSGA